MEYLGYIASLLIGIALGLIGSGGSVLTIPVLVYLLGVPPVIATAYSLFIVGITSLVGVIPRYAKGLVDVKTAIVFGLPSVVVVYLTRMHLLPIIPDQIITTAYFRLDKATAIMLLFALLMLLSSFSMIFKRKYSSPPVEVSEPKYNYLPILLEGIAVGFLTGLVGAGGGFIIIPALVLLCKIPIQKAIGTSLLIIAAKSLIGFIGDIVNDMIIDWPLLFIVSGLAIVGLFIGVRLSIRIPGHRLQAGFGWFVLAMSIYILLSEAYIK